MTKKNKLTICFLSIAIFIIAIVLVCFATKPVSADTNTYTLNVKNSSYYTIYVTGEDVTLSKSATSEYTSYIVENNTNITLNVVSELKVFTKWKITNGNSDVTISEISDYTKSKIQFKVTNDLTIECLYRDPTISDYGKVMSNRIILSTSDDLVALQKIISHGDIITANDSDIITSYGLLFDSYENYKDADDKLNFIQNNNLYSLVCNGYYLVKNNISIFEDSFTGIGTANNSFNGVFCGNNNGNISQIVALINSNISSTSSDLYYGLFAYLGENAIVRNIKVNTSMGISNNNTESNHTIYAGGLAGYAKDALIYNVNVASTIAIDSVYNVCCGNVIGCIEDFGISSLNELKTDLSKSSTVISSSMSINSGIICGDVKTTNGKDIYFKDLIIDASSYSMNIKGEGNASNFSSNLNLKIGLLCGSIDDIETKIENITIIAENGYNIYANINCGNEYVGGLVGYVNSNSQSVELGKISFTCGSAAHGTIKAISSNQSSKTNIYVAGLIGYINGDNFKTLDSFKQGIIKENNIVKDINPIFQGDYIIRATQNGLADANMKYGKCVASGLIARGYIDLNGTEEAQTTDVVIIKDGSLTIEATQSSIASHESYSNGTTTNSVASDKEHCVASLFTGLVDNKYVTKEYKYINFYADNVYLNTTREMSSKAMGDISIGMLVAYSNGIEYNNINMYLNDSSITCNSLSYEVKNTNTYTNNSYVGGAIGYFDSDNDHKTCNSLSIKGYDWHKNEETGNALEITSIQNTKPGEGDYKGENYVGGLIGEMHNCSLKNSNFIGTKGISKIVMRAHEDPDSAFCGGLIGFVRIETESLKSTVQNNKIKDVDVYGEETVNIVYANPDIYVGGIVGGTYLGSGAGVGIDFINNKVYNCNISAIGFERTNVYAGGINGCITWTSRLNVNFIENYIYNCNIKAEVSTTSGGTTMMNSYAAGLCPFFRNAIITLNHNMVINTNIKSNAENDSYACGLYYNDTASNANVTSKYNYSNAVLSAKNIYGVFNISNSSNYNYYNSYSNTYTGEEGKLIIPSTKIVLSNEIDISISDNANQYTIADTLKKNQNNYHLNLQNNSDFAIVDVYKVKSNVTTSYVWDKVEIWVNPIEDNSTIFDSLNSEEELHDAGWYILAIVTINNNVSSTVFSIDDIGFSYINETSEYVYESTDDSGVQSFKNLMYPYNSFNNKFVIETESSSYDSGDAQNQINYVESLNSDNKKEIKAYLYQNIMNLKITFIATSDGYPEFYYNEDSSNVVLNNSLNSIGDYGTYSLSKILNSSNNYVYEIIIDFNYDITEDKTIYLSFTTDGSNLKDICTINLIHNKRNLKGATYASYTLPLNYHMDEAKWDSENQKFVIKANSITKIIPVYVYGNDPFQTNIITEDNCNYVNYSINNNYSYNSTIEANGSLESDSNGSGTVTITDKEDSTKTINLQFIVSSTYHNVTYDFSNMEFNGLNSSLNNDGNNSYKFTLTIDDGYCGEFDKLIIEIGTTSYNFCNATEKISGISIKADGKELEYPYVFAIDTKVYEITITNDLLTDDISIKAKVSRLFTITFDLQNAGGDDESNIMTFQVKDNSIKLGEYFGENSSNKKSLNEWVGKATRYGYLFKGFYLIDYASTIVSYGKSFDELLESNIIISVDLHFYARWTFKVELIEAPGTYIEPSFSSSFMEEYSGEDEDVTKSIQLPINMYDGYVFTIKKDDNYIGESNVRAYSITNNSSNNEIHEITIEKYYENMYLYFIPPEAITGYLVIETFISNSEFIVGENASAVFDEIIPEDGIFTYKYVVNHRNDGDVKSYAYSDDIKNKAKIFGIKITCDSDYKLPEGTEVEVYYQKIVNGSVNEKIVGNYTIDESYRSDNFILLSDFKLLDKQTSAFTDETFNSFLGNNKTVSEVYYFVVTPPNGSSSLDKMINVTISGGYVYNENGSYEFVEGERNGSSSAINSILNDIYNERFKNESSEQKVEYTLIPSRETTLSFDSSEYTFEDDKTFESITLSLENYNIDNTEGVIVLNSNGSVKSEKSNIDIDILSLYLNIDDGNIVISGSNDNINFTNIITLTKTSSDYSWYNVDLSKYEYFKIVNESGSNSYLKSIKIISNKREYEYTDLTTIITNGKVTLNQEIINDVRHDGKYFILAVQFKDESNNIVSVDSGNIKLVVDRYNYSPIITDVKGQVTIFFNLSDICNGLNQTKITFTINNDIYIISAVQLLEVDNYMKPAMGEVRTSNLL